MDVGQIKGEKSDPARESRVRSSTALKGCQGQSSSRSSDSLNSWLIVNQLWVEKLADRWSSSVILIDTFPERNWVICTYLMYTYHPVYHRCKHGLQFATSNLHLSPQFYLGRWPMVTINWAFKTFVKKNRNWIVQVSPTYGSSPKFYHSFLSCIPSWQEKWQRAIKSFNEFLQLGKKRKSTQRTRLVSGDTELFLVRLSFFWAACQCEKWRWKVKVEHIADGNLPFSNLGQNKCLNIVCLHSLTDTTLFSVK